MKTKDKRFMVSLRSGITIYDIKREIGCMTSNITHGMTVEDLIYNRTIYGIFLGFIFSSLFFMTLWLMIKLGE